MSNIETAAQAKPMAVAVGPTEEEEEEERAMFKVAISVSTVSTCGVFGSPTVGGGGGGSTAWRSTLCYKFFATFYVVAMLAAFTLGFLLLVLSVRAGRPRRRAAAAAVARKKVIMWVSLGMVYVAVVTGTIVALVESFLEA